MSDVKKRINYGWEWDNGFDNCLTDEKFYTFGSYIDLCGMTVEDALAAQNGCGCGGGGTGGSSTPSKVLNQLTLTTEPTGNGEETEVIITSQKPINGTVNVTVTIDGVEKEFTVTETPFRTGIKLDSKYANIEKPSVTSTDDTYTYKINSSIDDGIFTLTVKNSNGTTLKTYKYKYGNVIDTDIIPSPSEKIGYSFDGWDTIIPATMPDGNLTVTPSYTINQYTITLIVDGEVYKEITQDYATKINTPEKPILNGYTFSKWNETIPSVMPAANKTITAILTPNTYLITYKNEGVKLFTDSYKYKGTVIPRLVPSSCTKEGYTTIGWDTEIPPTMPYENLVINVLYSINQYTVTLNDYDGSELFKVKQDYNTTIDYSELVEPSRIGYTFDGWDIELPSKTPSSDKVITAKYTINKYTITYKSNNVVYLTKEFEYDSAITSVKDPVMEGHTFEGWDNLPSRMPAEDIEVVAIFKPITYTVTFVDENGNVIKTLLKDYGTTISDSEKPVLTKEGYTFEGWTDVPTVSGDVTITPLFSINTYKLVFVIDGVEGEPIDTEYNSEITYPSVDEREGYTFSWDNDIDRMPASDLVINGTYTINTYKLVFVIDGVEGEPIDIEYNSEIVYPSVDEREGYTFSWDNDIERMPANDLVINGVYVVNQYRLTIIIDGETKYSESLDYNSTISYPTISVDEGYKLIWEDELPVNMPAKDVTITGSIVLDIKTEKMYFVCDYDNIIDDIEIDDMGSIEVEKGKTYDVPFVTPIPIPYPDDDASDEVFDQYEIDSKYSYLLLIPAKYEYTVYSDSTNITRNFKTEDRIEIDGVSYIKVTRRKVASAARVVTKVHQVELAARGFMLTFIINNEVYSEAEILYDSPLTYPDVTVDEGYTLTWNDELPEKMPDMDLVIKGTLTKDGGEEEPPTEIIPTMYFVCDYNNIIDDIDIKDMSSIEIERGKTYDVPFVTPIPIPYPDDDASDEEFDQYEIDSKYSYLLLIPEEFNYIVYSDGTNISRNFKSEGRIEIDGVSYIKVTRRKVASAARVVTKVHNIEIN